MKKGLILFNMSTRVEWDQGIVNRNYHVFQALKKSNEFDTILSIDFLPFTFKKKIKTMLKGKPWHKNNETVYKSFAVRVDRDVEDQRIFYMTALHARSLKKIVQALHFPDDITIWSYNPFMAPILTDFSNAFVVFDAVDNWAEHPAYAKFVPKIESYYKIIQKRSNLIFTVSEGLVDFFGKKEHVFFVPNGVDSEHFKQGTCNKEWKNNHSAAVIGYHGVIQSRVNTAIFEYLAKKHPTYQFIIAGPIWKEVKSACTMLQKKYKNIQFIGSIPYAELPDIISCFDVAIIPHKIDAFTQSMNPLKLYEYLAAGKPVVASAIAGADQFQDLVQLAVSPEDFSSKIVEALQTDSDELRNRRQHMAALHSWNKRTTLLFDILHKYSPMIK
ncbi:MAG TPA: glycosyltransferase [Patescibacteria group bacterium]|nr:glycosyltransferase [Patescibacteria group bacterium]